MAPLFASCGVNLQIKKGAYFLTLDKISIGNNVLISNYCTLGAGTIQIEDGALLGPSVTINPENHTLKEGSYRNGRPIAGEIIVGQGAWLGAQSVLLAGARIGRGALVAAGAVVNKPVDEYTIVAGVPARVIKDLRPIIAETTNCKG